MSSPEIPQPWKLGMYLMICLLGGVALSVIILLALSINRGSKVDSLELAIMMAIVAYLIFACVSIWKQWQVVLTKDGVFKGYGKSLKYIPWIDSEVHITNAVFIVRGRDGEVSINSFIFKNRREFISFIYGAGSKIV